MPAVAVLALASLSISSPATALEGVCVANCGDYTPAYTPDDTPDYYTPDDTPVYTPDPVTYPNVTRDADGTAHPNPGYRWLNDDPGDFRVELLPWGTPDADNPNVVWAGDGSRQPASGYLWLNDVSGDYRVLPVSAGTPDSDNPNVVWAGDGSRRAAPGYRWLNDISGDYRVELVPAGTPDADNPNVVWSGDGMRRAAPGYRWLNDIEGDFRVEAVPAGTPDSGNFNVVWGGDGTRHPAPGFRWLNDIPGDFNVEAVAAGAPDDDNPNVVWAEAGIRRPAPGFRWLNDISGDFSVEAIPAGEPDSDNVNVVWGDDGTRHPAAGFRWLNDIPGDFRVEAIPQTDELERLAAQAGAPFDNSAGVSQIALDTSVVDLRNLGGDGAPIDMSDFPDVGTAAQTLRTRRFVEVPSPSGYKSEAERRTQLARLTDTEIDTELARIQRTLERMKDDFLNESSTLDGWLTESQKAENEALKACFQLLLTGSLKRWEDDWDRFPKLKKMAENGLRYLSFEKPVSDLIKNPDNVEAEQDLARSYMIELYGVLRNFDEELISENGPPAAQLASFAVDYSLAVTRWTIARAQIEAISDNLGKPNGKLEAQKAISRLQESLMEERKRRQAAEASDS